MPIATAQVYRTSERVTEDEVVTEAVDSMGMQYAVIAGLRTETGPERFVIAYPNEESLRDLLAAPSIIAAGFSSREEAAAGSRAYVAPALGQRRPGGTERGETEGRINEADFGELHRDRRDSGSAWRKLARFIVTSYGDIAASVFVIF